MKFNVYWESGSETGNTQIEATNEADAEDILKEQKEYDVDFVQATEIKQRGPA